MGGQGKLLWSEDDSPGARRTEGHEHVSMAWKRLFGTEYHPSRATRVLDHGDCIERQFGPISVWNIYGAWDEIRDNSPDGKGVPLERDTQGGMMPHPGAR
jgi:hypothetical protein